MDSSPHSASSMSDELRHSFAIQEGEGELEGGHQHIHLPNPSYWPVVLSVALVIAFLGLLFADTAFWIFLVAIPLILIGALGWALEDPMAPLPELYEPVYQRPEVVHSKYQLGQNVVDARGNYLGKVQARFRRYLLVERGSLVPVVHYGPVNAIKDEVKKNTLFLTLSEDELDNRGLNTVPDDLYDDAPEAGIPVVRGAAQFARRPLSPAETGHYHYGRRSPGINTDASGSYFRDDIQPKPQTYVTELAYATDKQIPPREISPD